MTEQELQAIEERWRKATPGPWKTNGAMRQTVINDEFSLISNSANPLNAAAIAHAPTDIAALLAEVRRLKVENKLLDHRRRFSYREQSKKYLSILRLKREVRRLQTENESMQNCFNCKHQIMGGTCRYHYQCRNATTLKGTGKSFWGQRANRRMMAIT